MKKSLNSIFNHIYVLTLFILIGLIFTGCTLLVIGLIIQMSIQGQFIPALFVALVAVFFITLIGTLLTEDGEEY